MSYLQRHMKRALLSTTDTQISKERDHFGTVRITDLQTPIHLCPSMFCWKRRNSWAIHRLLRKAEMVCCHKPKLKISFDWFDRWKFLGPNTRNNVSGDALKHYIIRNNIRFLNAARRFFEVVNGNARVKLPNMTEYFKDSRFHHTQILKTSCSQGI